MADIDDWADAEAGLLLSMISWLGPNDFPQILAQSLRHHASRLAITTVEKPLFDFSDII